MSSGVTMNNNSIYSIHKLKALARKLDRENNYTPCHSEKVANYALEICRRLNIRGKKKDLIITACLIHDVGKVGVNPGVLAKKEKLTAMELYQIRLHPKISANLAKEAGCDRKIIEILYYHHVWFNGNGYPDARKKGQRLPIGARILAVCDAYEAMTSERSYKEVMSSGEAIEELRKTAIKQFDPRLVEVFVREIIGEGNG